MFEFGTMGEILIIAVATLILLGPKEIPTVLRLLGRSIYKLKKFSTLIRAQLEPHLQEGEFEEYQKHVNQWITDPLPSLPSPKKSKKSPSSRRKHSQKSSPENLQK